MLDLLKENYRGKINSPHHYQTHSLLPRRASVHEDGVTYQISAEGFEIGIGTAKYLPVSYDIRNQLLPFNRFRFRCAGDDGCQTCISPNRRGTCVTFASVKLPAHAFSISADSVDPLELMQEYQDRTASAIRSPRSCTSHRQGRSAETVPVPGLAAQPCCSPD